MVQVTFMLHDSDFDRLEAIRQQTGQDLTANETARLLLEKELRHRFPGLPQFDGNGILINPQRPG